MSDGTFSDEADKFVFHMYSLGCHALQTINQPANMHSLSGPSLLSPRIGQRTIECIIDLRTASVKNV